MNEPRGPWDQPLREPDTGPTPIVVIVTDLMKDDDKPEAVHHLDYSDFRARKFMGRLTYWAIRNKRSIETMSKSDWDKIQNGLYK